MLLTRGELDIVDFDLTRRVRVELERDRDDARQIHILRAQVRNAIAAAWATHTGARVSLAAAESEVKAADLAVAGVRKEALAGQRREGALIGT